MDAKLRCHLHVLCFLSALYLSSPVTCLYTIPSVDTPLAAVENSSNVTVFCRVLLSGDITRTSWFISKPASSPPMLMTFDLVTGEGTGQFANFFATGDLVGSTDFSSWSNLTIRNFDSSFNSAALGCGVSTVEAIFTLRIISPPVLKDLGVVTTVENSNLSLNLTGSLGYPAYPSQNTQQATLTYQWTHNGVAINTTASTNPNVSVYPEITFNPVLRTQSGNYSMTASTEGGDSTGYFILDVLAPPDGTREPSEMFGVTGMDTIITAFTGVTGNPTPNSTWTRDGVPLNSGMMYNTDNTGVLVISNVMLSDTGNYTNTLHNMFNNESFTNNFTISLQVLSPPSSPQSASVINITSSSAVLRWLNPVSVGVPAFVRFSIELATTSKVLLMSAIAVNNVDSSFTNTLIVTGLDSNTNYTISIRTVSTHPAVGDLVSDSIMQAITTFASVPQFEQSNVYNNDGMLELEWTLRRTGGLPLRSISVICSGGNSTSLSNRSVCTPDMCGDDGSTRLGPVMAGSSYTCSVTASNAVGNTTSDTNTVITLTGIPSSPVVLASVDGLQVRLQVTTAYAGVVAGDNSLHFNVSVYNTTSSGPKLLYQISLYPLISDFLGTSVSLTHAYDPSLQPGSYQFSATAGNRYGSSLKSRLTTAVSLVQSSTNSPIAVIVTVSVVSVVIVVIAVSVLIAVVICIMRRYTGSMTKNTVKSTTTSPTAQAPVALQRVQSVENESYGVLGGGVPQSIELKDNAAYSTVKPPNQSIAVNSNVAYGITPSTTEPNYI